MTTSANTLTLSAPVAVAAAARLLEGTGLPRDRSTRTAEVLVLAELWGVASHGLLRLPHYVRRLRRGGADPRAELVTVLDTGPLVVLDGRQGLGHWQAWEGAELAVARAKEYGVGLAAIGNSGHCGALGTYGLPGLDDDVLTLIFSNGPAVMPAWGGSDPLLSTSPLAVGIPGAEHPAIIDLATTSVARGKIAVHAASGTELPEGWALDSSGKPTTDPQAALHGMLAPLGGAKGYALALMVETLTGGLIGPNLSTDVADMFSRDDDGEPQGIAHLLVALDSTRLDASGDPHAAAGRIAQLFDAATADGGRVPGSRRTALRRVEEGQVIELPASVRSDLEASAEELGVELGLP